MENQQKLVNVVYVVAAALVAYIFYNLMLGFRVIDIFELEARIANVDLIVRGVSLSLGFVVAVVLWRSDRINQYLNEAVVELSRVTWPAQKETKNATFIVIIMVIISGLFLGGLDSIWSWLARFVI